VYDGLGGGLGAVQRQPVLVLMVERAKNEADEPKILTKKLRLNLDRLRDRLDPSVKTDYTYS
jgi:hypothetical protein